MSSPKNSDIGDVVQWLRDLMQHAKLSERNNVLLYFSHLPKKQVIENVSLSERKYFLQQDLAPEELEAIAQGHNYQLLRFQKGLHQYTPMHFGRQEQNSHIYKEPSFHLVTRERVHVSHTLRKDILHPYKTTIQEYKQPELETLAQQIIMDKDMLQAFEEIKQQPVQQYIQTKAA